MDFQPDQLKKLIEDIHASPQMVVLDFAGAGSQALAWLHGVGGSSRTILEATDCYASTSLIDLIGFEPEKFASLEVARAMDWPDGPAPNVVAAEVSGEVKVGEGVIVRFRADRLDRDGDTLVLVDYKSGKPPSSAKKEDTRRQHLLHEVATGRTLQAVAYALGTPPPLHGVGRYLALRPQIGDAPQEARRSSVSSDDDEMAVAFNHAVAVIVSGLRVGGLPPRVEEAHKPGKTPPACAHCPVVQACLRSDPGYHQRIVSWMAGEGGSRSEVADSARALWWLGVERPDGGGP